MHSRRVLLLIAVAVLPLAGAPGTARAGGFATVGLSSLPDGVRPGTPWRVELTVLQHGRRPLDGVRPQLTIRSGDSVRVVSAVPAGRAGRYRAVVRFPHAGR